MIISIIITVSPQNRTRKCMCMHESVCVYCSVVSPLYYLLIAVNNQQNTDQRPSNTPNYNGACDYSMRNEATAATSQLGVTFIFTVFKACQMPSPNIQNKNNVSLIYLFPFIFMWNKTSIFIIISNSINLR